MFKQSFEKGNATVEYAILIGTISILAIGGLAALGMTITSNYDSAIETASSHPTPDMVGGMSETSPLPTPTLQISLEPPLPEERPLEEIGDDPTGNEKERDPNNFYDNFDDGDSEGWLSTEGTSWYMDDNRYCTAPKGGEQRTLAGDTGWTNYTVSTQAELKQGKGFGLYFRAAGGKKLNAYVFQYDPGFGRGAFLFRQVINGREKSPFARNWAPKDYNWYNQVRNITIQVEGNTFTAFIDGNQVLQGTHSEFTQGQIGLRTWSASEACFDDITVVPLNSSATSVLSRN